MQHNDGISALNIHRVALIGILLALLVPGCSAPGLVGAPVQTIIWKDSIGAITALSVHPQGRYVAAGGSSGTVRVWDSTNGQIMTTISNGAEITAVNYNPGGTQIAVSSVDGWIRVWDATTGQFVQSLQVAARVSAFAWNSDGTRMLIGSVDSAINLVDMQRKGQVIRKYPGHSGPVTDVTWVPTTRNFVSTGLDNKFILWDSLTGSVIGTLLVPGPAYSVSVPFDARAMAVATDGGGVRLYSLRAPNKIGNVFGAGAPVRHVAWSPDATRIAAASDDTAVRVFDSASGLQVAILTGSPQTPLSLVWLDKDRVMAGAPDGTIRTWTVGNLPVPKGPPTPTQGSPPTP
jgi:WD40 repeat protein